MAKCFIDTNVFFYAADTSDPVKRARAGEDPEDATPDNTLRSYILNATGARLYEEYSMMGEPSQTEGAAEGVDGRAHPSTRSRI